MYRNTTPILFALLAAALFAPTQTSAQVAPMALSRWDPFADTTPFADPFSIFRALTPFGGLGGQLSSSTADRGFVRGIPLDVIEKENEWEIKADIPGVDKNSVKVEVENDQLNIGVEKEESKEEEKEEEGVRYHRIERSSAFARRVVRLPKSADLEHIDAKYENGVLDIHVPKAKEAEKSRKVEVA